jgi:predicted dehydrogenase
MRFLLDDEVALVHAVRSLRTSVSTELTAFLALQFTRGTPGSIYCSFETSFRRSRIEVIGDGGMLSAENFTRSGISATLKAEFGKNDEIADGWEQQIQVPDLYVKEITLFSDAILHNRPNPLSGENGLANQRVLNAAIQRS